MYIFIIINIYYRNKYIVLCYQDNYTLEQSVGGMINIMSSQVKTEGFLMNLFLPLCFRVGIGKKGKIHKNHK